MINFYFGPTKHLLDEAGIIISQSYTNMKYEHLDAYDELMEENDPKLKEALEGAIKGVSYVVEGTEKLLSGLKCGHIEDATKRLAYWPKMTPPTWAELNTRSRALRNAIQIELKEYFYYQYSKQKGKKFQAWKTDWQPSLNVFHNIEIDVFCAVDCYALCHETASVFHCMRILEVGLRALAADVGLAFELQQWQNIIEQIELKITAERKALPKGAEKNERLQFLSEAAKEFFYFKEGWRNHVSHGRGNYDENQALSVLEHVRTFMNHLASRLSEATT